jgi:hypothetical protein
MLAYLYARTKPGEDPTFTLDRHTGGTLSFGCQHEVPGQWAQTLLCTPAQVLWLNCGPASSSARGEVYLGLRIVIEGALARANARETPWRAIFFAGAGQHSGKRVLPLDELALGVIATQKHHLPVLTKKEFRS